MENRFTFHSNGDYGVVASADRLTYACGPRELTRGPADGENRRKCLANPSVATLLCMGRYPCAAGCVVKSLLQMAVKRDVVVVHLQKKTPGLSVDSTRWGPIRGPNSRKLEIVVAVPINVYLLVIPCGSLSNWLTYIYGCLSVQCSSINNLI